jgi:hypothetical protein
MTLNKWTPKVCTFCFSRPGEAAPVYPDVAMRAQFGLWNVNAEKFAYCSEMCRLLHLFECYQRKEAPKYANTPETAKEAP